MNIHAQIKALFDQASAKLAEVEQATDADAVKAINEAAQAYLDQAEVLKGSLKLQQQLQAPLMPAPLPTTPTPTPEAGGPDPTIKAIYTLRFGDENDAIQAILQDLHGADYQAQRWEQTKAFNRWLRDYKNPLIPEWGRKFLWTPRTIKVALDEGQEVSAMKTVMVEAASQLGGYVVPEDWRASIVERLAAESIVRQRATVATTSRDVYEQPAAKGGDDQYSSSVRVTWVDETPLAGTAATNLQWGMEKIPIFTVMAETFFSRSQVEDAAFNLPAYLADKLAEASLIDEDNRFLVGTGQGCPWGILPGGVNALTLTEKLTGASGAMAFDGLIDLYYAIAARYRQNACWIAENATYAEIAKLKAATTGEYLWREMFSIHAASTPRPTQLMGKPALEQEALPTVTGNAYPLIFGDLRGYTVVDRVGMSIERYLDSATARQDMVCYLMRRRLGGKVMEPWRFAVQKVTA